jgi:hypothetical protein
MSDSKPKFELWPYNPSIAGGILAAIIFAILAGIHAFRLAKHRTWFCVPFVIGGLVSHIRCSLYLVVLELTLSTV